MKKFLLLFIAVAGIAAAQSKVGSTAAPFLNIGIGPRAVSMGGAFVATANDITSLYWNPAGAARTELSSALFSHTTWFADISYNWAGAMINMDNLGTIGLSFTYLDYGNMEVTTLREPDGTGEIFSPKDMAIGLTYSYNLTDRFSLGGTAKYVHQNIWNTNGSAFAADLGILFHSDIYGLRIGATISNFGTDMQLDGKDLFIQADINRQIFGNNDQILARLNTDSYPLPLLFRVGVAMDPFNIENHKFTIAIDALHPNDNDESFSIGAEYLFMNLIALRAGYKSLTLSGADNFRLANSEEGLALGFGINYDFAPNLGLFIDYAYQDFGKLSYAQQFSLGIKF
jgi:hypothetical protein